jgi:hypothetical protein
MPKLNGKLQPFLTGRPVDDFLFCPSEAERERLKKLHSRRVTPLSCGNRPGSNRTGRSSPVASSYTVGSYRQAIWRACDLAPPPPEHLARL